RIWSELLGHERVGRHDNFFELGGDSIRIIGIISKAEQQGISLTIEHIFRHQTIAAIVRQLAPGLPPAPRQSSVSLITDADWALLPHGIEDAYSVSRLQMGMIFHNQMSSKLGMYHDIFSFHLQTRKWDLNIFQTVVDALIKKHPTLRTSFDLTNYSEPLQLVHKKTVIPITFLDVSSHDKQTQNQVIADTIERDKEVQFDLGKAPLLRMFVHYLGDGNLQYTVSFHHAILDGWSLASFQTELFSEYAKLSSAGGGPLELAPLTSSPKTAVAAERLSLQSEDAKSFWASYLSGRSMASLPPLQGAEVVATDGSVEVVIEPDLRARLIHLASALNVPFRTILLAAHLRLTSMLTGTDDVISGVVGNTRLAATDGEKVLGLFLNTLPFRQKLGSGSWRVLIQDVFQNELAVATFRTYPYFDLFLQNGRVQLFETVFNYTNFHIYDDLKKVDSIETLSGSVFESTNFALTLNAISQGDESWLSWSFDGRRLSADQVRRIAEYYLRMLESIVENPDETHVAKNYLSQIERRQVVEEWNATQREYPRDQCI
ncbi:condensation domain-containing protein, partial [Dokdonella soli]